MIDKVVIPTIAGPTASGKSRFAIKVAKSTQQYFGNKVEILSADSRQIYKSLDIGTAKIQPSDTGGVKHHFIDIIELEKTYSSGQFAKDSTGLIDKLLSESIVPIVCGGTGFYIQALFDGLDTGPRDEESKLKAQDLLKDLSREQQYSILESIDTESAQKFNDMNPVRIARAVEYYIQTGEKFSDIQKHTPPQKYTPLYILPDCIESESLRQNLYSKINKRCDEMWNSGLENETTNALTQLGLTMEDIQIEGERIYNLPNSLNTVGYKEMLLYLNGLDKSQAIEMFKRNTRRYAKRQITWFRRVKKRNPNQTIVVDFDSDGSIDKMLERIKIQSSF